MQKAGHEILLWPPNRNSANVKPNQWPSNANIEPFLELKVEDLLVVLDLGGSQVCGGVSDTIFLLCKFGLG